MPGDGHFPVKVGGEIYRIGFLRSLAQVAHNSLSRQHLVVSGPTVVRVHPMRRSCALA